jgi:hypothetical protein
MKKVVKRDVRLNTKIARGKHVSVQLSRYDMEDGWGLNTAACP